MAAGPAMVRRAASVLRALNGSSTSHPKWRDVCVPAQRGLATRTKGMTDEQIKAISKYDPFLAEQIRAAEAQGINAADWRSLESIPVPRTRPQSHGSLEQGPHLSLAGTSSRQSAAEQEDDEVSKLYKSAKASISKFFGVPGVRKK
mmetsp:Transcript_31585/g.58040  ORF Transcript_31585/g.58040 Transcript_31585/m.58040 type:complete len:146 (-) Transcript_31585:66-503(-)